MKILHTSDLHLASPLTSRLDPRLARIRRRELLSSFGYEVKGDAESTVDFTLPRSLDAVLLSYNEIQKEAGLDLSKYAGKKVTRYTYLLPEQEGYEGRVYANIIVYRSRVVAADLTGVGEKGFVRPLEPWSTEK